MFSMKRSRWLLAGLFAGIILIWYGLGMATWRDEQVVYYNAGVELYKQGDLEHAYKAFDLSANVYVRDQQRTYLQRLVYPKPSQELAAQAMFQKGKVLIRAQKLKPAVEAFKDSLMLNPGNGYSGISVDEANRMHDEALTVKYDLEELFKNNPELAKGEGKGKPKKGDGEGRKPVPSQDPGTKPGKGNRDEI